MYTYVSLVFHTYVIIYSPIPKSIPSSLSSTRFFLFIF